MAATMQTQAAPSAAVPLQQIACALLRWAVPGSQHPFAKLTRGPNATGDYLEHLSSTEQPPPL